MKTKFSGILTLFLAFVVQFAFAQEKTISGTISDASGLPLPGVNIIIVGTSTGSQSNFDGNYSLKASPGDVLTYSFMGYKTQSVTVGTSNTIDLTLAEDLAELDEVIVVAYGSQTKKSIVGAVSSIDAATIEKQQTVSVTSTLQGTVSGVNIVQSGGQPGDNPTIRIRGVGSINASADPLIIVDGAPFNGNLNSISGDQVESMSVLKDASSTALYGSRGANGVIVITTKRGKKDMPVQVNFSTKTGIANQAVDFHELATTDEFTKYSWEALRNEQLYSQGSTATDAAQYATDNLVSVLGYDPYGNGAPVGTDGELVTTDKLWDNDWSDNLFNNSAVRQEYAFNIAGGSEKTNYFLGLNYVDQEGAIETSNFTRGTVRMNIDSELTDWLTTGVNMFYSHSDQNYPTQSGTSFQSAQQWYYSVSSYYPLYQRDGNGSLILDGNGDRIYDYGNNSGSQSVNGVRPVFGGENGVGALYNYDVRYKRDLTSVNGYAKIDFTDYLNFKTQYYYEKYVFDSYEYVHNEYGYAANVGGRVSQDRDFVTTKNWTNSLNFNKSFGNHNVGANLIYETYKRENDELGAQGVGFLPNVQVLNGSTTPENVSGAFTNEGLMSYLARASYNYSEKYFIEGSYRRDGSSRFADHVRWGDFYSVGGSWIISEENFLNDSNVISFLKLKGSYGELGNNNILDSAGNALYFPYLSLYETGWNQLDNTGVILGSVADPNLTWEKTASANIGLDFGFFQDRISGSLEFYNKASKDLIYNQPLAISTGNDAITTNVGAIKNYGFELEITTRNINSKNFQWSTNFNISKNEMEITELTQESFINGTKRWEVGKSTYEFYIQEWAGVDPETGQGTWFKDVIGADGEPTGEKEVTSVYAEASRNYSGKSSLPDFVGGMNNYLRYKNWDLNFLFNFSVGSYIYDSSYANLMGSMENAGRAAHADIANRWQQPGDITDVPMLTTANNDFNSTSTRFLYENNYLRLKALNFGYNFDSSITDRLGVTNLRVYFQGDNLWTLQSHDGLDPEQSFAGTTDSRTYNQRIMSLGVNLQF
ncbi:TonB-dependent receptor [Formosa agariphila KMM 3901]|uniref:TonB-dependent receptor n=1 Tax=Formosa agariphila (strain DSM 15362 / KCTC 12365 / LMG 23005 / KMM 3901 / M-2Alg 35-1) TaxID=1347342 RepID=T2KIK9_FORAG|nr:TonB-dependent receptor [Formosa agariphila]CDF78268.1 TonB-dependent receptor [Formosa agariphila KMM 3901]